MTYNGSFYTKHIPVLRCKNQPVDAVERNIGCLFDIDTKDVQANTHCGQKAELRIVMYLVCRVTTVLLSAVKINEHTSATFA